MLKKLVKGLLALSVVLSLNLFSNVEVKATEVADANAALAYNQALLNEQALAAYNKALADYQAILLAQYNQALAAQLQAAQLVNHNFNQTQMAAFNQAFLLNAVATQQNAQYQSMVNYTNLEYSDYLKNDFNKYAQAGLKTFVGYEGLAH